MADSARTKIVDYLLGVLLAVYFWWAKRFDRAEKCEDSPDGTHQYRCKDWKTMCKWCGTIEKPHQGARGK